jgi:hypothetical protein
MIGRNVLPGGMFIELDGAERALASKWKGAAR